MLDISAFIIAGGKSSRMGDDKAFLDLGGQLLIEHAIRQAKAVAEELFIVGPKEKFSAYGRIVLDIYPDCGPLGGLHAALNRSRSDLNLMLGVDTPFIKTEFLAYLLKEASKNSALVTVPRVKNGLQPLCAVYRREFLPIAEAALKAGKYKIDALFSPVLTSVIDLESEAMKQRSFDSAMFDNINSPEDYERAKMKVTPRSRATK